MPSRSIHTPADRARPRWERACASAPRRAPAAPLLFALAISLPFAARAQEPDGGAAPICAPERSRIAELEQRLSTERQALDSSRALEQRCAADLSASGQRLEQCRDVGKACQESRDALCSATDSLAAAVLRGESAPAGVQSCVTPEHQQALVIEEVGWAGTLQSLEALRAFESGESEKLPARINPRSAAEDAASRLLGDDRGPLGVLYRRLLVEALRRVAPRFLSRLQGAGPQAVEAFFQAKGPLEPELLDEARRGVKVANAQAREPGAAGPALVTALKLVEAYLDLACSAPHARNDGSCERARQLRQELELSGPLVVERREQSIWATPCSALSPRVALGWVEEFPSHGLADEADWNAIQDGAFARLFSCYLSDASGGASFSAWLERRLPGPESLTGRTLERLDGVRARFAPGGREDRCARAVRALQTLPPPAGCALPHQVREPLQLWLREQSSLQEATAPLPVAACMALLRVLWSGQSAEMPASFERPPTVNELVVAGPANPATSAMARLRQSCAARSGALETFPDDLAHLARLAALEGEELPEPPWHADPATSEPLELRRAADASGFAAWARQLAAGHSACEALGLDASRCLACQRSPGGAWDCALLGQLQRQWSRWSRLVAMTLGFALLASALLTWSIRFWRGWRDAGRSTSRVRADLANASIQVRADWLRFLSPARFRFLHVELPREPAWERWGERAGLLRAPGNVFTERDVNEAAAVARALDAELALLVHDEGASPELGAVRAMLEWSAKSGGKAVQILPVAADRLKWARDQSDLLDLLEQTSLRGNPFEIRGRITSSSQFFNRERLVSGLLAGIQAGQWTVVTGLRRFGKSSLALEVGRQLNGAAAYVDLAGFHHEIAFLDSPDEAAALILRYLCGRLVESARERFSREKTPPPQLPAEGPLDSPALARWFDAFGDWCRRANGGRQASALIVLDEIEQAIGVGPERVQRALDVLAVVLGRLRAALGDEGGQSGTKPGLIICGAIHPLLWAPLPLFAGQSILGAFTRVCVPCLKEEAAFSMMRGLGARQGIRFTEAALEVIVREAHGIPLLVRRIGSSLLELYDPERARQGSLGAVEVGQEGARAAVKREEEEGSPLRVWVESEIGDAHNPAGALLRHLAREGADSAASLRAMATRLSLDQFAQSGIERLLSAAELRRRAEEAGSVTLQMLAETGLIVAEGALTSPDTYRFPDGIVRRILARGRGASPFEI